MLEQSRDLAFALWRRSALARLAIIVCAVLAGLMLADRILVGLVGWSAWSPFGAWASDFAHRSHDSWGPMAEAVDQFKADPGGRLYEALFFDRGVKFQYPPTSLLPWLAMDQVGVSLSYVTLNHLNRLVLIANAIAVGWLVWLLLKRAGLTAQDPRAGHGLAILCGFACLFYYPMTMAWYLGQIQVWINALFAFACVAWLLDKRILAGVLIAGVTLIKPQFGLFAVWGLIRRDWRFTGAFAGFGGVVGLISLAIFGLQNHLDYLAVLSELSRHGESYLNNQSVNGLLNRLFQNGPNLEFEHRALPPYNPFIHAVTLLSSAALIGLALWPRKDASKSGLFDFMFAATAFTIASPIAWEHHYGVTAPVVAGLFCLLAARPDTRPREWWTFALCFVFAALSLRFLDITASTPLNVLQSHLFFAGLGFLYLLWTLRAEAARQFAYAASERDLHSASGAIEKSA